MSEQFYFYKVLVALRNGQDLTGKDGLLTPLIKQLTEAAIRGNTEHNQKMDNANPKQELDIIPTVDLF